MWSPASFRMNTVPVAGSDTRPTVMEVFGAAPLSSTENQWASWAEQAIGRPERFLTSTEIWRKATSSAIAAPIRNSVNRGIMNIPGIRLLTACCVLALSAMYGGTQAAEVKSIAVLVPEQATDFGWNQQGVESAKAAASKMGVEITVAQGLGYGDVRPTLRELAEDGVGLMIAHASGYNT